MKEELVRLDGVPGVAPNEFIFFTQAGNNADVRKAYEIMQNQYVLRPDDRIDFHTASSVLDHIQEKLLDNPAWTLCRCMEEPIPPGHSEQLQARPSIRKQLEGFQKETKSQSENLSNDRNKHKKDRSTPER
jgi:hypothetical protein